MTWVKLHDMDLHNMDQAQDTVITFDRRLDNIPAPVYYASLLGLTRALNELISSEEVESADAGSIVCINA